MEKPTEIGPTTSEPKASRKRLCATCGVSEKEHGTFASGEMHSFVPRAKGFAAMPRERLSEIASKGGKAAHAQGTAHRFSHEEAVAAGRKGGQATTSKYGAVGARRKGRNVTDA